MTNRISIPLAEADEQFWKTLREKYPEHSRLDIQIVDLDAIPAFGEEQFWAILSLFNWSADSRAEIIEPAVARLAESPLAHIYLFEDMLAEKLFQLDTRAHAAVAYPGDFLSVDGFLYVRAAVVAAGKEHFYEVLKEPEQMDPEADFELLLSLASLAFERKTQKTFDYFPPVSYETYSNEKGWEE